MGDFENFVTPQQADEPEAELVQAASECLDRFTAFFNKCDANGMDTELHFPHAMLSGSERLDWAHAGQHPADFFENLRSSGWHHTRYEAKEPALICKDKVHFVVTYSRRNYSDNILTMHKNLWIVTRVSGKWGISLRSY
jgi:hypothetical protein